MNQHVLEALTELAHDTEFGALLFSNMTGMGDKLTAYFVHRGVSQLEAEILTIAYQQGALDALAFASRSHERAMREALG